MSDALKDLSRDELTRLSEHLSNAAGELDAAAKIHRSDDIDDPLQQVRRLLGEVRDGVLTAIEKGWGGEADRS